jgi:hypothetical protein
LQATPLHRFGAGSAAAASQASSATLPLGIAVRATTKAAAIRGRDSSPRSGILAPVMPPVFWIGLGIAGFVFLVGVVSGARSRTTSLATGALMGAYLGVMVAFPLLAIGLATS